MDKKALIERATSAPSQAMILPIMVAEIVEAMEKIANAMTSGPGAMDMIEEFHKKFRLASASKPKVLTRGLYEFRTALMQEELDEYHDAYKKKDLEGQLDALVDLVYVVLGTAYIQGLDFNEAFRRVHEANMKKKRVENIEDSKRKSSFDVVKPEGWEPPDLGDLV